MYSYPLIRKICQSLLGDFCRACAFCERALGTFLLLNELFICFVAIFDISSERTGFTLRTTLKYINPIEDRCLNFQTQEESRNSTCDDLLTFSSFLKGKWLYFFLLKSIIQILPSRVSSRLIQLNGD